MKSLRIKTIIGILLAALLCASLIFAALSAIPRTRSAEDEPISSNVTIDDENGALSVYISGPDVLAADGGGYHVPQNAVVTVTVVNETGIFSSLSIKGTADEKEITITNGDGIYDYGCVVENVKAGSNFSVTVKSRAVFASDTGKLFSRPYTVDDEQDVFALGRIFEGEGTADDYAAFGFDVNAEGGGVDETKRAAANSALQHGYYRLMSNIIVESSSTENTSIPFTGIGSRKEGGMPFQGCFDFNGRYAYINLSTTRFTDSDFVTVNNVKTADFGFFSYIYGDAKGNGFAYPCLVRGADVRGSIAVNTRNNNTSGGDNSDTSGGGDSAYRINAGGLAGTVGKNVVLDGVSSQVSVSVQAKRATLSLGGLFGFCSAPVEDWSAMRYEGTYGDISGITEGDNASVYIGGLAGILQNAYVNSFENNTNSTSFIANAEADTSGSAFVGGLAGVVYVGPAVNDFPETSAPRNITIRNIDSSIQSSFVLSAVIDNESNENSINADDFIGNNTPNNDDDGSAGAVAGGLVGGMYTDGDNTISISRVNFTGTGSVPLSVSAQTLDANSNGAVFAGGMVGYIETGSASKILYTASSNTEETEQPTFTFACSVNVSATQNGVGPAYAGGLFGYNAFQISDGTDELHFYLTDEGSDFEVEAVQSALSNFSGSLLYDVCAGLFTSKLQSGYSVSGINLYAENATVTARREAGSTAIGDVAAGGFAGKAQGSGSVEDNDISIISNVSVNFGRDVSVNALGYSYNSTFSGVGNNVYAGGFIGYAESYGASGSYGLSGITVDFNGVTANPAAAYAVRGVQNAVSGGGDYKTEGYVGGVFGMLANCFASDINFKGNTASNSLIYFTSSNDPNTASVGGLVGATRSGAGSNSVSYGSGTLTNYTDYKIAGGRVENAHVVGRAYYNGTNEKTYDIYVGGAIGVFGCERDRDTYGNNLYGTVSEVYVYDSVIEAIGEEDMLTYAGGVFGGIWYRAILRAENCAVIGSSVTASSVSYEAYAAGIAGIIQSSTVRGCYVIDTSVHAESEGNNAYAGGIFSAVESGGTYQNISEVQNCYSNALLSASAPTRYIGYVGAIGTDKSSDNSSNSVSVSYGNDNYFVSENAGTTTALVNVNKSGSGSNYPIRLTPGSNALELETGGNNRRADIYANVDSDLIKISPGGIVSISGKTVTASSQGTAYASVVVTVDGNNYELCSYPIVVDEGTSVDSFGLTVYDADSGDALPEGYEGMHSYTEGNNVYTYVLVNSGQAGMVQNLLVKPNGTNYFPSAAAVYSANAAEQSDYNAYIRDILNNKTTVQPSHFNGKVSLAFTGTLGSQTQFTLTPSLSLSERVIVVVEYTANGQKYGVIAEFRPNEVIGITIEPSADTPSMGKIENSDGTYTYIYAPGDTVRFEATVHHKHTYGSYMVEVVFSGSGVSPNGTITIPADANMGDKFTVTCNLLNNYTENPVPPATAQIVVRTDIASSFALSGANVSSDRKAVSGTPYNFTATPQPGYGLAPTVTITRDGKTAVLDDIVAGQKGNASWTWKDENDETQSESFTIPYAYKESDGSYTFTLPADMMTGITALVIDISFSKVYNIVFLPNYADSTVEPLILTVAAGSTLSQLSKDKDILRQIEAKAEEFASSRYGYDLEGFYLASEANSLSSYGNSFDDLLGSATLTVNGPLMFYARWAYNVVIDSPRGVTVSSGLTPGLVGEGNIVPIDDKNGFSFEISVPNGWVGEPRFSAFIVDKEGNAQDITADFTGADGEYSVSRDVLQGLTKKYRSGILYIRIHADSLALYAQDDDTQKIDALYSDGIFTAQYSVNTEAGAKDVTFTFGTALPEGTSLRLYYSKNGAALWAGSYTAEGSSVSGVTICASGAIAVNGSLGADNTSQFSPLNGFDPVPNRTDAASEVFSLVVTLPDNALNFAFGTEETVASSVSVNAYEFDGEQIKHGDTVIAVGKDGAPSWSAPSTVRPDAQCAIKFYRAAVRTVSGTSSGKTLTAEYNIKDGAEGIEDHRHPAASTRYVWEVRRVDGDSFVTETAAVTLENGALLMQSGTAMYFAAQEGAASFDFSQVAAGEYIVTLLRVTNTQYPAAGMPVSTALTIMVV
ncbi:MAG TPA: hypothetical protein H9729_05000 [Candidatus Borkfalkia excrementigallinarum]|uniref:Uncharacterized protein n=1 Tax=Candidatus Borkfalkia excrementigallinarum TaxID=2838506 RepID=A0A9D1ZV41_9FIRM|nr:hypothetical protein [Candidatus Borkfalkia excrementigallinarum]